MKEIVIQHFFEGYVSAIELAAHAAGAFDRHVDTAGTVFSRLNAVSMNHEFGVAPTHVVKLIDGVLAGELSLDALDAICFCLEASDSFTWDTDTPEGERVADSLFWLGSPEINYKLTTAVLGKIREFLLSGQDTLTSEDVVKRRGSRPHLLNVNERNRNRMSNDR